MTAVVSQPTRPEEFREPRWARFLFASTTAAWLWLVVRLYMAYIYLPAGWGKITSGKWLFGDGSPIQGLVGGAISSEDTPAWYASFLQTVVETRPSSKPGRGIMVVKCELTNQRREVVFTFEAVNVVATRPQGADKVVE